LINKIGKIRQRQMDWQNEIKATLIGEKCENVHCNNILEAGKMVCEHLLPQGSFKFKQYRMFRQNVRIVCGCVNLDNYGKACNLYGLRYCRIVEHFPDAEEWIKERVKR
jgi:hypothetical protein